MNINAYVYAYNWNMINTCTLMFGWTIFHLQSQLLFALLCFWQPNTDCFSSNLYLLFCSVIYGCDLNYFSLFWSTFCQKYSVHGHLKNYIWAVSMFDSIYLTRCILHWLHFIVIVLRYWYMYIILCYAFEYKVQILSKTLIDVYAKAKEYLLIIICK